MIKMNREKIREKLLKRRSILGIIFFIILSPLLVPLLLINKLGELSEELADTIQFPFIRIINNNVEKYKINLEKQLPKEEETIPIPKIDIEKYEKVKKFNENLRKGLTNRK